MNQEQNNIDAFLRLAAFEVEDNGFSDRVLQALPQRAGWERRLQRIWQIVCLIAALIIVWYSHAINIVMTDLKVFLHTLPLNYDMSQLMLLCTTPMLLIMVATIVWSKRLIY